MSSAPPLLQRRLAVGPSLALLCAVAFGCSNTGQPEVAYPAFAVPAAPSAITAGDFTVTLEEAVVAFGPAYFCAAASGSATLCDTALAELTEITAIDALNPAPQPLGVVNGFTGEIRSASYDFGISWLLTEGERRRAPAAPGGHSARLRGRAVSGDAAVDFTANVDVLAQFQGQRAVPTAPTSAIIGEEGARLEVHIDPGAWLEGVDWQAVVDSGVQPYAIELGTPEHNAIVIAMISTRPPEFVWSGK